MIPLHKLEQLPRSQRLRKCSKIFEDAEQRVISGKRNPGWAEREYLADVANVLAKDASFAEAARVELDCAARELATVLLDAPDGLPRRPLNTIRHIVSKEIGIQIADWDFLDSEGSLADNQRLVIPGVKVFLEDIRSPFNVGSIFRTAESFGVEKILISPQCASPDHPRARRSAMGCVELLPWAEADLQSVTGTLFALETGGTPLEEFVFPERGVMIIGSEELGVSPAALSAAEGSGGRVSIPTYGAKGSLNVAVAFGIAMRAWTKGLVNEADYSPTEKLPRI